MSDLIKYALSDDQKLIDDVSNDNKSDHEIELNQENEFNLETKLNKSIESNQTDNQFIEKTDQLHEISDSNNEFNLTNNDLNNPKFEDDVYSKNILDHKLSVMNLNEKEIILNENEINLNENEINLNENEINLNEKEINSSVNQFYDNLKTTEDNQIDQFETSNVNQFKESELSNTILDENQFNAISKSNELENEQQSSNGDNQQSDNQDSENKHDSQQVEKLKTELNRLKKHLIQIEEDYTNELIEVQQREQNLEEELIKARSEIEKLNHRLNNTGPLVAIRQQAEQALDERDKALLKCSKLEDEVQRGQASLSNLQLVIERMQKDHDQRLQTVNKLHEQNLIEERCRYSQLENEINKYQLKLNESNNALQAAARLSQQLHAKQETIDQLRTHLQKKEELVNRLHDEINSLNASTEGKVDKQFVKNLVVGYFNAPSDKKQDVARLLARILDFNEIEMKKSGIQLGYSTNTEIGHRRQNSNTSTTSSNFAQDESIMQQFVHFLEEESKVHKLPVAKKLANDLTKIVSSSDIKATNLNATSNLISNASSSSFAIANKNESNLIVESNSLQQTNQEIKPMLIPNSAIMNAQLNKLSFNGNKSSFSNTNNTLQQQQLQNTSTTSLNQSSSSNNSSNNNLTTETKTTSIKPIVLNFNNNN